MHWDPIHLSPYIHPCLELMVMTIIEIYHMISWFMKRIQNWVTVKVYGSWTNIYISKNYPSQARSRATPTQWNIEKLIVGENILSWWAVQVTQNNSIKWNQCPKYHPHPLFLLPWNPQWWSWVSRNRLWNWYKNWRTLSCLASFYNPHGHPSSENLMTSFTYCYCGSW